MKLDLASFRPLNVQRATEGFKCYDNQPLTYWTTALAGEVGELCNMIKKMQRVERGGIDGGSSYTAKDINKEMLKEEIGGIAIYLDLLASLLDISLEEAIIDTFNSKSEKYKFSQFVEPLSAK
jgi:NTP pyrophosphatase (non-canonical NTP hydrolase)